MGAPIISRITHDPARITGKWAKADAEINRRYKKFGRELKKVLVDELEKYVQQKRLAGNVSVTLWRDDLEFAVNDEQRWQYTGFNASALAHITEIIQRLIEQYILGVSAFDMSERHFMEHFIEEAMESGARGVLTNLSSQDPSYREMMNIAGVLASDAYKDALAISVSQSYQDWKSLTDRMRTNIAWLVTEGVAAGVHPSKLADEIIKQGVKPGTARNIARTELIGAYRKARIAEGMRAEKNYGIRVKYLWLSALSPTTRRTHAARHGKLYTKEEIADFYSKNGNRYNCKCSFSEVVVDKDGNPRSRAYMPRLIKQRMAWMNALSKAA